MIVATNLTKRFGNVVAVDSINFRIERGRVVGFLGPNGAGKTTTIRMIAGFLPPTAGSVSVDEFDVVRSPIAVRQRIGYLPEATPLYTEMRVKDYLKFRARLYRVERPRRARAIDRVLDQCGLRDVRRRLIGHLSKGYRQRVGLAASLVHEPPVLILDEPTVGLDPTQIREMRNLVRGLAGRHTVLLSSHILPEVELTCDEIVMIAGGRIQAQGTIESLRTIAIRDSQYVVETDAVDADALIGSLPGVATTRTEELNDRWRRVVVVPTRGGADLREMIGRKLAGSGAAIRALHRDVPSLEHMFMQQLAEGQTPAQILAPDAEIRA